MAKFKVGDHVQWTVWNQCYRHREPLDFIIRNLDGGYANIETEDQLYKYCAELNQLILVWSEPLSPFDQAVHDYIQRELSHV